MALAVEGDLGGFCVMGDFAGIGFIAQNQFVARSNELA
jgi:hypothetical protein